MADDEFDDPYQDDAVYQPPGAGVRNTSRDEPKHSGLGIASFVLSMLSGLSLFVIFAVAGMMEASNPGGLDEESTEAVVIGLAMFAFMGLALVSICLGIGSFFQSNRKKIFGILGLCFSGLALFATVGLIIIGLVAQAQGM